LWRFERKFGKILGSMLSGLKQTLNKFPTWSTESASNLILTSAVFFILGISAASVFVSRHFEDFYFFLLSVFGFLLLILFWQKKRARLIFFCFLFLIFGLWRYNFSLPNFQTNEIKNYNGQTVDFAGMVSDEPDKRSDHIKLTVKVEEAGGKKVGGLVLLKAPLYPEYKYGDKLQVSCKIKAPEKFDDFDYAAYLSRYGIYSVCNFPKEIHLVQSGQGNGFYKVVYSLKNKLADIGGKILPEPQASFLAALLYGARQGIPEDLTEQFNRVSLTHIIAISGYNISLVVGILLPFFTLFFLPRKWAFPFVILGVVFFVIFAGASASVVRAGIMGVIAVLANNTSRAPQSGRILAVVAFLMLVFNPKLLFFDRGFSLSFAATAGLICLVPIVKNYFSWWKKGVGFRKIFEESLSATLFTLPLTIYFFDRLSFVSLAANLFVLPIIPMIMLFGFIALVGGLVWQGLGFVLAAVPWVLINYVFKITEFFASFKFSSIDFGKVPWAVPVILYGVLFAWMAWVKRPKREVVKVDEEVGEYEIIEEIHNS
jgi:competence protein ComEC